MFKDDSKPFNKKIPSTQICNIATPNFKPNNNQSLLKITQGIIENPTTYMRSSKNEIVEKNGSQIFDLTKEDLKNQVSVKKDSFMKEHNGLNLPKKFNEDIVIANKSSKQKDGNEASLLSLAIYRDRLNLSEDNANLDVSALDFKWNSEIKKDLKSKIGVNQAHKIYHLIKRNKALNLELREKFLKISEILNFGKKFDLVLQKQPGTFKDTFSNFKGLSTAIIGIFHRLKARKTKSGVSTNKRLNLLCQSPPKKLITKAENKIWVKKCLIYRKNYKRKQIMRRTRLKLKKRLQKQLGVISSTETGKKNIEQNNLKFNKKNLKNNGLVFTNNKKNKNLSHYPFKSEKIDLNTVSAKEKCALIAPDDCHEIKSRDQKDLIFDEGLEESEKEFSRVQNIELFSEHNKNLFNFDMEELSRSINNCEDTLYGSIMREEKDIQFKKYNTEFES